ncbi:phosphatase PAP2 family protein [Phyllobacterium sp. 0TCS1.6C]|uniref:phosphatase PAP2 family protein n=1 Tax=unclassified Phyllobacterium TaxID=2638441 RepID=UPI002264DFC7|nr:MULTISPECIES: phosphatase PAP2 family protein [unclassified Phyllobacterium]MCX8280445.1 phosphatase PAP2 family protein [Phyllobacterium sp. 0TCS1.6C]MCX8295106.1 phosphatase PAP2 family protein [Phyllobacterium sp. 0TCS1.6A]
MNAGGGGIGERLKYVTRRYVHALTARPADWADPAWTGGMTMAVAFIVFLILAVHPYDEFLSRTFTADDHPMRNLRYVTDIGLSKWYVVPAFSIAVCLIAIDWKSLPPSRSARLAIVYSQATYAFWAISAAGTLTAIVKYLIGRARPAFIDSWGTGYFSPFAGGDDWASFPSGHSTTMGAVGCILALWFPRWRLPILLATMGIAFTRLIARAHYPTDIIAGYSVGFFVAIAMARFLANRRIGFRARKARLWPAVRRGQLH